MVEGSILWSIKLAVEQGFENIVMEKNCLLVTNALNSQNVAPSDLSSDHLRHLEFSSDFESISWSFMTIEENKLAHSIPWEIVSRVWAINFPFIVDFLFPSSSLSALCVASFKIMSQTMS